MKEIDASASVFLPFDPLATAHELRRAINSGDANDPELRGLRKSLDLFAASIWNIGGNVSSIENADVPQPEISELHRRQRMATLYPALGFYWSALNAVMKDGNEASGEIGVGDAIDDLLDIDKELAEVEWLAAHHGRAEALAGLNFRYRHHLYMHVWPLRRYLEDMVLD